MRTTGQISILNVLYQHREECDFELRYKATLNTTRLHYYLSLLIISITCSSVKGFLRIKASGRCNKQRFVVIPRKDNIAK